MGDIEYLLKIMTSIGKNWLQKNTPSINMPFSSKVRAKNHPELKYSVTFVAKIGTIIKKGPVIMPHVSICSSLIVFLYSDSNCFSLTWNSTESSFEILTLKVCFKLTLI